MANVSGRDPYSGIRFRVKIGAEANIPEFKASKITGMAKNVEIFTYTEGGDDDGGDIERKMAGQNKVDDIVIERYYHGDNSLEKWHDDFREGKDVRSDITITLYEKAGGADKLTSWEWKDCLPQKWEIDDFDTTRSDPIKERITISCEKFNYQTPPTGGAKAITEASYDY